MTEESREGARTSGEVIRGHFILEHDDVRRAIWEVSGKARRALGVLVALWALWWVIPRVVNDARGDPWWFPVLGIAFSIGVLLFVYRRAASNVMANKTTEERDISWEFDDAGYRVKTPGSESRSAWDTVHRTVEAKTTFFLYPASNIYQLIPKRAFRDEDLPRIRELFRTRVTPRPVKNKVRVLVLWAVLIVAFLAMWQFLDTTPQNPPNTEQSEPQ